MHRPREPVALGRGEEDVLLHVVEVLVRQAGLLLGERRVRLHLGVRLERPEIVLEPGHECQQYADEASRNTSVLLLQELYPVLNIARLPMVLSALISLVVVAGTPASGWKAIWHTMPVFRWQVLLVVLGVVTAPIGIWMSGSLSFFALHYAVALIVFFSSVILLRDRRSLTTALTILLLAGAVVAGFSLSSAATTFGGTDRTAIGVTLDPNDLAQLFVAMVPLSMYMAQRRGARSLIWWIATGLLVVAIVPTQSRGGILGIGVCALVLLSFGTSPFRRFINVVGVCAGAVGMALAAKGGGAEHLSSFSDYSGGEGRIAIWKRGIVWMTWRPWGSRPRQLPALLRLAQWP